MENLKLSDLVGKEIVDVRFHYCSEDEYGLQTFQSFILLNSDTIIDFPKFDENEYLHLSEENLSYLERMYNSGNSIEGKLKNKIVGQRIVDFYFTYFNNELDSDQSSFIKLSNDLYLKENNYGPVGIANIGLVVFDIEQFDFEIKRLNGIDVNVRSFTDIQNRF